jgi:hypothetical protein
MHFALYRSHEDSPRTDTRATPGQYLNTCVFAECLPLASSTSTSWSLMIYMYYAMRIKVLRCDTNVMSTVLDSAVPGKRVDVYTLRQSKVRERHGRVVYVFYVLILCLTVPNLTISLKVHGWHAASSSLIISSYA